MCLYLCAMGPSSTYGQYLRTQKYKKDLEEVREKEEKATWARINALLEKHYK